MGSLGGAIDGGRSASAGKDGQGRIGMTGAERMQETAFDDAMSEARGDQPGGRKLDDRAASPPELPRKPTLDLDPKTIFGGAGTTTTALRTIPPGPIGFIVGGAVIADIVHDRFFSDSPETPEVSSTDDVPELAEAAKPSDDIKIGGKVQSQAARRGWTEQAIKDAVDEPEATSKAQNKSNGHDATAYFDKDGDYVVVDDVTGEVIQISDRNDPGWVPDDTIDTPYQPD